MNWVKRGLVYGPRGERSWARHSALTPTPFLVSDEVIRVYAGFRDDQGISRIGYVDVDATDPSRVITVSKEPILDIGRPGCFDDHGVILGDVVRSQEGVRMYYVGFQHADKVKFLAFTGLARSQDDGLSFQRVSETPVLDRSDEGLFIRAIHTVRQDQGVWRLWYAAGRRWEYIAGAPYPAYSIYCLESGDGITLGGAGRLCLEGRDGEYRIGRPRVDRSDGLYTMYYTRGTVAGDYLPGYAESRDGLVWSRMDERVGIDPSPDGWDSRTLCYPSPCRVNGKVYLFYNGNDMGRDGFGFAELAAEEK